MGPRHPIFVLLKVGCRDHLQELAEGRLRFRRLRVYRDLESKGRPHYDGNEGLAAVFQADRIKTVMKVGDREIEISKDTGLLDQVIKSWATTGGAGFERRRGNARRRPSAAA